MELTLRAQAGRELGSRASRRLRREGRVPAVVYGQDMEPVLVDVDHRELMAALVTEAGLNALIAVDVDGGETYTTLPREVQRHPYKPFITHLDFVKIDLTEKTEAEVAIDFVGESVGVRTGGGIISTIKTTVLIEALPTEIPNSIEIDVSDLDVGDSLKVSELTMPAGVELVDDPDDTLAIVTLPAAEVAAEVEEVELLEGEELPEGEEGEAAAAEESEATEE